MHVSRALFSIAALLALPRVSLAQAATPPPALQAAQALIASRDFDSAAVLLRDVVHQQPANGQAWISLGAAERGRGRVEEATAASASAPRAAATWTAMGTMTLSLARGSTAAPPGQGDGCA